MPKKKKKKLYGPKGSWATSYRKLMSLVKLATNPELYIDAPPGDLPASVRLRSSTECFKSGVLKSNTRMIEHTKSLEYAESMLVKYQSWLNKYIQRKAQQCRKTSSSKS